MRGLTKSIAIRCGEASVPGLHNGADLLLREKLHSRMQGGSWPQAESLDLEGAQAG